MRKKSKTALAAVLAIAPLAAGADAIPGVRVGPFNFDDVPFHTALVQIVKGTGVSVVMQDDIPGTLSAEGVAGRLDVIVGKMCGYSGASCEFRDGAIVVSLRAKDDARGDMAQALALGGESRPVVAQETSFPAAPVPKVWKLKAGGAIHAQLEAWAKDAGWTFAWRAKRSWLVPADTEFGGEFDVAVEAVVKALYEQGKPLTLKIWEGNKVAEVIDGAV